MKTTFTQRIVMLSLALLLAVLPARALQRGDVNADGYVDVQDLAIIIDVLLGKTEAANYGARPNITLNNNGDIDIADVSGAIDIILGKVDTDLEACYLNLSNKAEPMMNLEPAYCDFVRGVLFHLNTLTTDEALCGWGDPGIADLNFNTWGPSTPQLAGAYYRLCHGVDMCNKYLATHTENAQALAEARFLRALQYFYLMDLFGNVPFSTSSDVVVSQAAQASRADVFGFVESELLDVAPQLAEPRKADYGHADRAAAWLLLARLYLNAEVYTGVSQWDKARTYAGMVLGSGYHLLDDNANDSYTDFQRLFMGDNDTNGAQCEIILPLPQSRFDGDVYGSYVAPWQGTNFINAATYDYSAAMDNPNGSNQTWAGIRSRYKMAELFGYSLPTGLTPNGYARQVGDDRALFNSNGRQAETTNPNNFTNGFAYNKFTGVRTDGGPTMGSNGEVGIDFPLLRVAEAYLTFAEADMRLNGGVCSAEGLDKIKELRARSHASPLERVSAAELRTEWLREFAFEGHRRSDLVRFNSYGIAKGDDVMASYHWDWKGGNKAELLGCFDRARNIFPLPVQAMDENPNLVQNPGYGDLVGREFTASTSAESVVTLEDNGAIYFEWTECVFSDEYIVPVNYDFVLNVEGEDIVLRSGLTALGTVFLGKDLNAVLMEHLPNLSRLSEMPVVSCSAYVVAHAPGAADVKSNTMKLNLLPYKLPVVLWYIIGSGVGDGSWNNIPSAINQSMTALYPSPDDPSVLDYTAHFQEGAMFKLIKTPGSWDEQWGSYDGSLDMPVKNNGGAYNFTVPATGYYQISLNTATDECQIVRLRLASSTVYDAMSMPGDYQGWDASANFMSAFGTSQPEHHDWFATMEFANAAELKFAANASWDDNWGGTTFPAGNAESGGIGIKVPAGLYIVHFNDIMKRYFFEEVLLADAPEFAITSPSDDVFDAAEAANLVMSWDEPSYNREHGIVTYTVLMGLADRPDVSPTELVQSTARGATIPTSTLQQRIMSMGGWDASTLPNEVPVTLQVKATADKAKTVMSSVVNLTVKPDRDVKPGFPAVGLWYVVGDCVGDGSWTNTPEAVGVSLAPMYPDPEDNTILRYADYFLAGAVFKLIKTPGSWDNQWSSVDGSLEKPTREVASNFVIPDAGYYEMTLNSASNTLVIKRMDDQVQATFTMITMPGTYQGWDVTSSAMLPINSEADNHNWKSTLNADLGGTEFKFAADGSWGVNWGASTFPVGIGVLNGANIPVLEGNYNVYFNDILGAYLFVGK